MDDVEAAGSDMARVATVYDIKMQSVKKMTSADLVVAVSPTADGQVVVRKTDPNQTHPYSATALLGKESLREDTKYAWKHSNGASHVWSGDAVSHLASPTDRQYDELRAAYREHLRT